MLLRGARNIHNIHGSSTYPGTSCTEYLRRMRASGTSMAGRCVQKTDGLSLNSFMEPHEASDSSKSSCRRSSKQLRMNVVFPRPLSPTTSRFTYFSAILGGTCRHALMRLWSGNIQNCGIYE